MENQLLAKTISILKRAEEIKFLKGEAFNIFTVLNIESDEVNLHNRFLAELLDPKGSHQLGSVFLNLFFNYILDSKTLSLTDEKKEIIISMQSSTNHVVTEYWLGTKNTVELNGGSLDICIISPSGQIRIENKIYAGDQHSQIARYCHDHTSKRNIVLYWNLFGTDASSESQLEMKKGSDYFILSHYTDTLNWLDLCIKEASNFPILRETIKQYHLLIQKLTYQNQSSQMKNELIQLLLENKENYLAAKNISEHLIQAQQSIYTNILDNLDAIFSTSNLTKMERSRSMRSDGGFLPLIRLMLNNMFFDVGLNIELDNSYCFFCVIEVGKNRSYTGINKWEKLNELAHFLNTKNYQTRRANSRTGWSLSGTYYFTNHFNFLNYIELSEPLRKELISDISKDILSVINASQIETYHASINFQSTDN